MTPATNSSAIDLLKVPRPFVPPGESNNSTGPGATELSPAEIKAKLESDPVLWNAKIDQACESCHLQYWYPGDKALLQRLDRHLRLLNEGTERANKTDDRR